MQTTILIDNVYGRLVSDNAHATQFIANQLAIPVKGARFTKWYKSGKWDGKKRFLERPSNRFLCGLLPFVRRMLTAENLPWREIDTRVVPSTLSDFPAWRGPEPRLYQKEAVSIAGKQVRGILRMGTGGGKTLVAGKLLADLRLPALFLVHRRELAQQAMTRFSEWLAPEAVGVIGADQWEERSVTIAMVQTLHARLRQDPKPVRAFLNTRGVIISDEAHRATSDTWGRLLRWTPAYYRFGLSGTPLVQDDVRDLTLIGLTGEVIVDISAKELAEQGWLAKPICSFYSLGEKGGSFEKLRYQDAYDRLIVQNGARNALGPILHHHESNQVLIIVKRIDHGTLLAEQFRMPFVSGQERDDIRQETYKMFREGRIRRLIASTIYDEGIDLPFLDVVVNLAGGKTIVPLFQRLGRAMHRTDTSQPIWFYDFLDQDNKHLRSHAEHRKRELERAGFEITLC